MSYLSASISTNTSGDNILVAAPAAAVGGASIRVHGYVLVAAGSVTVQWAQGAGTGTPLTGAMSLITGTPLVVTPYDPAHGRNAFYFALAANKGLNLVLGGAVQVSGHVLYSVL